MPGMLSTPRTVSPRNVATMIGVRRRISEFKEMRGTMYETRTTWPSRNCHVQPEELPRRLDHWLLSHHTLVRQDPIQATVGLVGQEEGVARKEEHPLGPHEVARPLSGGAPDTLTLALRIEDHQQVANRLERGVSTVTKCHDITRILQVVRWVASCASHDGQWRRVDGELRRAVERICRVLDNGDVIDHSRRRRQHRGHHRALRHFRCAGACYEESNHCE
jgi:hypothetical protein